MRGRRQPSQGSLPLPRPSQLRCREWTGGGMPEPEGEGKKAVSTAKYVERREKPKSRACLHQQLLHVVARGADLLARANWGKKGRKEFSTYPCFRSPSPGRRRLAGARSGRRLPHRPKLSSVRCSGGPARVSLLRKKVLGGVPSEHREKAVLPRRAKPMPRHAPYKKKCLSLLFSTRSACAS